MRGGIHKLKNIGIRGFSGESSRAQRRKLDRLKAKAQKKGEVLYVLLDEELR